MSVSEQKSIVVSSDHKGFSMHLPPADPSTLGIGLSSYCWKISLAEYLGDSLSEEIIIFIRDQPGASEKKCVSREILRRNQGKNKPVKEGHELLVHEVLQ